MVEESCFLVIMDKALSQGEKCLATRVFSGYLSHYLERKNDCYPKIRAARFLGLCPELNTKIIDKKIAQVELTSVH